METTFERQVYPAVSDRVKAMLADSLVLVVMMGGFAYIFSLFAELPDSARIIAGVFVFLLYDPLFTSFFGATLGHRMQGLRVRRGCDETRNIYFHHAFFRFVLKASLGWISLIGVSIHEKRLAIHDMAVGSVVVFADHIPQPKPPVVEVIEGHENQDVSQ
jgi:uncharacterized RDD family membrane protein YckC